MADLVIFGVGKVADVVYRHITHQGKDRVVAFTVDRAYIPAGAEFHGLPVVPFDGVADRFPPGAYEMLIAIGYHDLNAIRRQKYEAAKEKGYSLASFVSNKAGYGNWLTIGDNCIILDHVAIEPGVKIGNDVVIWSGALIGHHSQIDDDCWIAGHAVFGGSTRLGEAAFVGLGAIIGHEVQIGARSFLGAGVLVTKCAEPNSVFVARDTELFRLGTENFLKISKIR